jgi:hypothetical protein
MVLQGRSARAEDSCRGSVSRRFDRDAAVKGDAGINECVSA